MILLLSILVFLFTLYELSLDDFVFLRKNVSQITLFDICIVSGLVGLFISRLTYVLLHPSFAYFNPLVFFVVPYFPGLSLSGFLIGGCLAAYMLGIRRKLPLGRIFDVISLSLFPPASVFFVWEAFMVVLKKNFFVFGIYLLGALLFLLLFFLFKRFLTRSAWRDGSVSLFLLTFFALMQLSITLIGGKLKTFPLEVPVFALFFCILFVSLLFKKFKKDRV